MTPAAIYTAVRDLLFVVVVVFIAYRIYTDGKNAIRAEQLVQLEHQVEQQSNTLKQWYTETTDANNQLVQSISRINTAPVVVHDWVRSPASSYPAPTMLSGTATAAGNSTSSGGRDQPIGGTAADGSRRDQILADWKRYWETQLAAWRAEHAQWPTP